MDLPDRNTTLPHPEAKFGPDATISEEDVNPARAMIRHRMTFTGQQEPDDNKPAEEGTLSALGRMAINSLRSAELSRLAGGIDALLSCKDGDSTSSSDAVSSAGPDSPTLGAPFDHHPKPDPRDAARDPRDGRRRGNSFISRLRSR